MNTTLPVEFLQSLQGLPGFDKENFIAVHERRDQLVSIRFNPDKIKSAADTYFTGAHPVPWSEYGFYLPVRPSFTLDPLLHAGVYYVQEASSMFLEQCLKQSVDLSKPLKVLDLCAAPGGKSTLLQSLISADALLVSNEVIKTRVPVLIENLAKWGGANVIVTNNDPVDFQRLESFFDVMVIDAPCSGSGLFRRDPDAISEWSEASVHTCSMRQQRIISDAYHCLKKDGVLIYSTCSYSKEEDEFICDWLLDHFSVTNIPLEIPADWNIVRSVSDKHAAYGYRFYPDKTKGEGFFIACFRKNDGSDHEEIALRKRKINTASRAVVNIVQPWLKNPDRLQIFEMEQELFAFPAHLGASLSDISSALYIRKAGVRLGKIIGTDLVPHHELAVSTLVNDQLPYVSLKKEDALQYLRKEEVTITGASRGWALVRYEDHNLGWIKLLGNRSNNYYPKEWRVRKSGNN